jgi:hypothetical protein
LVPTYFIAYAIITAAIICRRKHSELKNTPKHKNAQTLIHGFDELLYISANTNGYIKTEV